VLWQETLLLAWVLMPDHWHGLVRLGSTDRLSKCMLRIKSAVARAVNRSEGRSGRVWQDGFHDRAVRDPARLFEVARYVVLNPVRAGLVSNASDYPFWNSVWIGHWAADARLSHRGHGPLPPPSRSANSS